METNDKTADDIIFELNKMSLESLGSIFCIKIYDEDNKDYTDLSLKYNKTNKLHLSCSCSNSGDSLGCLHVRKGISSMVQSYTNAYTNTCDKKVRKQLQKDIKNFMI